MKLTTDRHVVLRIRVCGAVSPVSMFLAPAHRVKCTFYFSCCHTHLSFCANWWGCDVEQIELTNFELCLFHSAGAVSCDCVTACNLLLAVSEIWKLWLWRAWEIIQNCTWWIHVSVTTRGTLQLPSLWLLLSCMTVIFRKLHKIMKRDC